MKKILILSAFFVAISLNSLAKSNFSTVILPSDTLKKGKNYILFSKSENIDNVSFSKSKKSKENIVYIRFGFPAPIPTSNSVNATVISSKRYNEGGSIPIFDKIDILKGNYAEIKNDKDTKYRNLFTFTGVEFPLRLKLNSGKENVDLEFTEAGEWNIEIELKNN